MTTLTPPPADDFPNETATLSPLVSKSFGEPYFHTDGDIAALAFAKNGNVWSIDDTGLLRQWSPEGKMLSRAFLSDLETLWAFSGNAELLASGNDDLMLWDVGEGQLLARIKQKSWVTVVAFTPDGQTVASGHDDGKVRLWDVASKKMTGEIAAHPKPVSAIQFNPSGDRLATAGEDRQVRVWNAQTHQNIVSLASHTDRIPALTWSMDGRLLVSAGWDTSARVWQPGASPDPLMLLNSHADQVMTATFAPKGGLLACADSDYVITLWANPTEGKTSLVLTGHVDEVRALAFNAEGTLLASGGVDRVVHIWDTRTGKLVAGPTGKAKHDLAYVSGDSPKLASTGATTFRLWDVASGAEVAPSNDGPAHSVAASRDGRWLAVGGTDHFTRLYDLRSPGSPPAKLEATKPPVGSLAFSPDGSFLVATSPADGLAWIWNTEKPSSDAELILIEAADGCTLETCAVDSTGQFIAVGGVDYLSTSDRDGAVCVWDRTTKLKSATFDHGVYALAFDPQGRFLAGAGIDDLVYIWDVSSEREVFRLEGHSERINAVAFTQDGSYLVSGGDDMTMRIWDVLSGRLIVSREFDSAIQSLAFSTDGQFLFSGNGNTTCYQFDFKKLMDD
jgi:WD40 repeat protein